MTPSNHFIHGNLALAIQPAANRCHRVHLGHKTPGGEPLVSEIIKLESEIDWQRVIKQLPTDLQDDARGALEKAALAWQNAVDDYPTEDEAIEDLNRNHAFIMYGSRACILEETPENPLVGRQYLSADSFLLKHKPLKIQINDKLVPAAKVWLESPKRRNYKGIVFRPEGEAPSGYFNLWRGFSVEPSPAGSCQRFLDHIYENVCDGDDKRCHWVVSWLADMIQNPGRKCGTALALRGKQGTGKTVIGRHFGQLLGPHYKLTSDSSRHLKGNFNSIMEDCLLFQLEEATWGGDHQMAGRLKDLITGSVQMIERKGYEPYPVANHVRVLITGNNDWLIPAGMEERRFTVLDVAEHKMQDRKYFAEMEEELDNGGYAALLHYLRHYDITDRVHHSIFITDALVDQKIRSAEPEVKWWLDCLTTGTIPGDSGGVGETTIQSAFDNFRRSNQRGNVHNFGRVIKEWTGATKVRASNGTRPWCYRFPTLGECRARFAERMGPRTWEEPSEWAPDVSSVLSAPWR